MNPSEHEYVSFIQVNTQPEAQTQEERRGFLRRAGNGVLALGNTAIAAIELGLIIDPPAPHHEHEIIHNDTFNRYMQIAGHAFWVYRFAKGAIARARIARTGNGEVDHLFNW